MVKSFIISIKCIQFIKYNWLSNKSNNYISIGSTHLSIIKSINGSTTQYKLDFYNITSNITTTLANISNMSIKNIR